MRTHPGLNSLAAFVLAGFALAGRARADSITFTFDYYILPPHAGLQPPVGPGPGNYGSITISDSAVDPNRVDLSLTVLPLPAYAGGALEKFYLNFPTPFKTNHQFYLVPVNAAPGVASNTPYPTILGSVGYVDGTTNFEFANFIFDLSVDPTSTSLTFSGSLAFYNKLPNPD